MALPPTPRAVITGAASGLGRALALEVTRRGGRLLLCDIDDVGLEATATEVRRRGGEAWTVRCDVARYDEVAGLVERAKSSIGGVDLLCNNAGVATAGMVEEVSLDDWHWTLDIDLRGVIYGCHAFLPEMKRQRRGFIINVASAAGLLCPPMLGPYNVAKAGVVALSETLAAEARRDGVFVTALCPTFFRTRIAERGRGTDERMRSLTHRIMDRSSVQAPEVAAAAVDAVARGQLYALPMRDGRLAWRLKRAWPDRFAGLVMRSWARVERHLR
jgi:NAD(P)-dependent dehydrogenase (short-subunit alcohol dehydrogenase family)